MQVRCNKYRLFGSVFIEQAYQVFRFLCCPPSQLNFFTLYKFLHSGLTEHSIYCFTNSISPGRQVWSNQGSSGP